MIINVQSFPDYYYNTVVSISYRPMFHVNLDTPHIISVRLGFITVYHESAWQIVGIMQFSSPQKYCFASGWLA